ncbi:MAG: hypothetical protein AAGG08_05220 [Actinomycetota bacterium]
MTDSTSSAARARLDELDAASRAREAELHRLADEVPAAVSRTSLVRSMFGGLGDLLPLRRRRS